MITPHFRIQQTDTTVQIVIKAPYSNLQEFDVDVSDYTFIFTSSPYYLRLNLPGKLVDNDLKESKCNGDTDEFTFTYCKATKGEHFPDLDLIKKLLQSKVEIDNKESERKITICLNQSPLEELDVVTESGEHQYGFAMLGCHKLHHDVLQEFHEILEIDPQQVELPKRRLMRQQYEQGKFNVDHYLSDFIEDDEIMEIISLTPKWSDLNANEITFTNHELDYIKNLHDVEFRLNEVQLQYCYCCLLDILYAYCYDRRTTYFEGNIESGWTIIKLASSLSWLDGFQEPKDALVSAIRRSLIYPLYRNFKLSMKVLEDLKKLLKMGEKFILHCLIEMYDIFLCDTVSRYIINTLFINDYVTYIMKWDKIKWQCFISMVDQIEITKTELGLNLDEIEGFLSDKLNRLKHLQIDDVDSDDNQSDSSDSDTSTSSSSTTSSSSSTYESATEELSSALFECNISALTNS